MSKEEKRKLVPKLRFPEFKDKEEWEVKILGDVFYFKQGIQCAVEQQSHIVNEGWVRFIRIVDLTKNDEPIRYIENPGDEHNISEDDLFMVRYGNPGVVGYNYRGVIANNLFRIIPKQNGNVHNKFYYFVLNHLQPNIIALAGSSTMPALNFTTLHNLNIPYPFAPTEQQKIADCLSSLDELMAAQSRKLEALKAHKKGLMQALFPAEGETVPKLRFPEFRESGEWEEKKLSELGTLVPGLTYSPNDVRGNGLLVLRSSNIQNGQIALEDCVYVKTDIKGANLSQPNDILICVRNGSKTLIGKNAIIPKGMPLNTHGAFMTIFRSPSSNFIFQLFQTDAYRNQVAGDLGATINSINGGNFLKYRFIVPANPEEQQKIASCLSSLDALITTQTEKLEALKQHKKGLMQRLFPATGNTIETT